MASKRIAWSARNSDEEGPSRKGKKAGWQRKSRSQEGLAEEREIIKKRGGRSHPRSGAGNIKWDGSDEDALYEIKDVMTSHALSGSYLEKLFMDAVRQGKEAIYIVKFRKAGIRVECRIYRD